SKNNSLAQPDLEAGFFMRGRITDVHDDHRFQLKPRLFAEIIGMLIGQAIWGLSCAAAYAGLGNYFSFIAAPIAIFGWLLIWGDNGPPPWAESVGIHVVFGLCFYGAIGALIGLWARRPIT